MGFLHYLLTIIECNLKAQSGYNFVTLTMTRNEKKNLQSCIELHSSLHCPGIHHDLFCGGHRSRPVKCSAEDKGI